MIRNVLFNSQTIYAGENITVTIEANYPVIIEVYCFTTQPPPPKFIPCPDSGRHRLFVQQPFIFRTDGWAFENNGYVEFKIIDADGDSDTYKVEIEGLQSSLPSN